MIKDNRENIDTYLFTKFLNLRLKLQEHFNWLVWAISYYYYYNLFTNIESREVFFTDDLDLPSTESIVWLNGFEWKGVYIRVQTKSHSKYVFDEVKALNYLFFEYIQLIETHKESRHYLSNELIFPLISYAEFGGLVVMCSVCINKHNYEIMDVSNIQPQVNLEPKDNPKTPERLNTSNLLPHHPSYDVSHIMNEHHSFDKSYVLSINNDIKLNHFSREDLNNSVIFSKLTEKNLIKVIDDLYDQNIFSPGYSIPPKHKFMIISAIDIIPNLVNFNDNQPEYLYIDSNNNKYIKHFSHTRSEEFKADCKLDIDNLLKVNTESYQHNGIGYKLIYDKNASTVNNRATEYFTNFAIKNVNIPDDKLNFFEKLAYDNFNVLKSQFSDIKEITGDCIVMYNSINNIKLKYSLIKNNIDYRGSFIESSNFGLFIENFAKLLDSNITIDNPNSLKNFFHKYGVNTSLEFFLLPKLRSVKLANLIKLNILVKTMKDFFNYHEGLNFLTKINLINMNTAGGSDNYMAENSQMLKNGFFEFINEKSIQGTQKHKIYCMILSILQVSKCHKSFVKVFYEGLSYFFFFRLLKLRLLDKSTNFNIFNSSVIKQDMLLHDFISTAKKHPFMFLHVIEHHLKIQIDPVIKFKSSLSLENFISIFNDVSIIDQEPIVSSYIKTKELSFYLLTKFIHTNRNTTRYDYFKDNISEKKNSNFQTPINDTKVHIAATNNMKLMGNKINNPNVMTTKINQRANMMDVSSTIKDYSNISRLSQIPMNCNNITKVNLFNDFNLEDRNEEEAIMKGRIWETMSHDLDLMFPSILYKLIFKSDEKSKKDIYRSLKHHYIITKIDIIKDWKPSIEILLSDIITVDSSECVQLQPLILMFINSFLIDIDYNLCKEILYKIKESIKMLFSYNFDLLAVVNMLEGLITERKNYIECEAFYSKCLIFSMLLYGDPRGRGCFGNTFMIFPLWKVGRQTCVLENLLTSENFREMFYCQDYMFKNAITMATINNFYDNTVSYNKETINRKNVNLSDINFEDDDINEYSIKEIYILENNFFNFFKNKYFAFPSISDVKTSYAGFFYSEGFVTFLVKNMLMFSNSSQNLFDDSLLIKLRLYFSDINSTSDLSNKSVIATDTYKARKGNIFSTYMYDFLLDRLNYKKSAPGHIVLSWGLNRHNETTHNVFYINSRDMIFWHFLGYVISLRMRRLLMFILVGNIV
jgi:hypothetical protein